MSAKYDRAITVFSPDGHLFQVEYAMEAVKRGTTAVGVRGKDCIVLAVERKATAKLQDARTVRKIVSVDEHVCLAFAGLLADARVLVDRARVEAQSYRLTFDERPSVEHLASHIAGVQQKYTQSGGMRPFGVAALILGFDEAGAPSEWKANAIGKGSKTVREWLEKNYKEEEGEEAVHLAVRALIEVVEPTSKTMEVAVVRAGDAGVEVMSEEDLDALVKAVQAKKEAEAPAARGGMQVDS